MIKNILFTILAVLVAVSANSISAVWAKQDNKFSIWLLVVILISPLVFITYGLVTTKIGLALASSIIDSLLIVGTILVGLFLFKESSQILGFQYFGIALTLLGVFFILFSPYFTK